MGYTPLVLTENETIRQRLARTPKPLLIIILITMAISYYYEMYSVSAAKCSTDRQSDGR